MPGWRVGWLIIHDKNTGRLKQYKAGVKSLTQIVLGANSLMQAAMPRLLCTTPGSKDAQELAAFSEHYMNILRTNADICVAEAETCPELTVIEPMGAMYTMIKVEIDRLEGITDDADFCRQLLEEENLFLLPGQCFNMPNFVRLVICPPADVISGAFERLRAFCDHHRKAEYRHEEENGNSHKRAKHSH